MQMVNEKDYQDYVMQLLGSLLDGLDETRAKEIRQAFHDIMSWAQKGYAEVDVALFDSNIGLAKQAITATDSARMGHLINAKFYLREIENHLAAVIFARTVDNKVIIPSTEVHNDVNR